MIQAPLPGAIGTREIAEFWYWLGNASSAVSVYFLLQVVRIQAVHGKRLNNHSQRLAKIDNETEDTGGE
jgi:hypothetical protein